MRIAKPKSGFAAISAQSVPPATEEEEEAAAAKIFAKGLQAATEPKLEQLKTDGILKEICNAQVN